MDYNQTQWSIKKLVDTYKKGKINLSPPYQRNFIWSMSDQKDLIESIALKHPLPSIFLYESTKGIFEMVDGQQRSRTILNYLKDNHGNWSSEQQLKDFLDYKFPVTIITKLDAGVRIEDLYAKLNKTGKNLNNPELRKGEFFQTNFLNLNEKLAGKPIFQKLQLFANTSINRMNDVDLVSELTTYLINGVTDKKESVEKLYENDITIEKASEVESKFLNVINVISALDDEFPINKTRYKQRNDFYTFFQFVDSYKSKSLDDFKYFYEILIILSPFISPAEANCIPLREYARNCVTQSNSKQARSRRFEIMGNILLGKQKGPSVEQEQIQTYFDLGVDCFVQKDDFNTFDIDVLSKLDVL
jgi:hypothetical protein